VISAVSRTIRTQEHENRTSMLCGLLDQWPEPLFDPEGHAFASSRLQERNGDASRNDRFSRVASVWVLPDRGSCAVCGGRLPAITPKVGAGIRKSWTMTPTCPLNLGKSRLRSLGPWVLLRIFVLPPIGTKSRNRGGVTGVNHTNSMQASSMSCMGRRNFRFNRG
jgi:hypothetical protein